jgi:hypothetical protein
MVSEELPHPTAQLYLWKQIRQAIVADTCYSPPELCVLFAAQSVRTVVYNICCTATFSTYTATVLFTHALHTDVVAQSSSCKPRTAIALTITQW